MATKKKQKPVEHNRALKEKDVTRLNVLQQMHPGDLTPELEAEMKKLQTLRAKYGSR